MQNKPLIIANWKMNPQTLAEAERLFGAVKKGVRGIKGVEVVICPPHPYLLPISNHLSLLKLGAQNCHWEGRGAFTGEISPAMLKDAGCKYVILGHSERRIHFGETDEMINKKLKAAFKTGLNPIFCVGENSEERKNGRTQEILIRQLEAGVAGIAKHHLRNLVIAYEPVWAISGFDGQAADCNEIMTCSLLIRKIISRIYDAKTARDLRIIYGGSVNSQNAKDFIFCAGTDGLLVGGASLNATEFVNIVKNVSKK